MSRYVLIMPVFLLVMGLSTPLFAGYNVRTPQSADRLLTTRVTPTVAVSSQLSPLEIAQKAINQSAMDLYTHQTLGTPDVKVGETVTTVTYPILANTTDGQALELQGAFIRVILDTETGAVSQVLKRNTPVNTLPSANVSIAEVASQLNRTFKHDFYRNAGYLPFKIDTLDMLKEGAWISSAGQTHRAYYFVANGTFPSVVTDQGVKGPTDSRLIVVDSNNGQVLFSASTRAHAFNVTGKVDVYREDPISTPNPDMNIDTFFIDNQNNSLYGKYLTAHNLAIGDAVESDLDFTYFGVGGFDQLHMTEANAYHFITRFGVYADKLGQNPWTSITANVSAFDVGSFYDMTTGQIALFGNGSGDEAYSGDVVIHEYLHHLQDHKVGGVGDYEPCGLDLQSAARGICEASSQYQATSYMRDRQDNEWTASIFGWEYILNYDHSLTIESWGSGDEHDNASIIVAALWDLRRKLGGQTVDKIALEMLSYLHSGITVDEFLEDALIPAANAMSGFYNQYEEVIRRVFALRHIYGYQTGYTWAPMDGSYPELRDYADGVNDTQSYTVAGAANLNVVTDAYTRFDEYTTFEILDGSDNLVAGPFTKEEAMSLAVTVPGDTVKFKVVDTNPGDGLFGPGYRLMSIRAEDLNNQAPNNASTVLPLKKKEPFPVRVTTSTSAVDQEGHGLVIAKVEFGNNPEDTIYIDTESGFVAEVFKQTQDDRVISNTAKDVRVTLADWFGASTTTTTQITAIPFSPNIFATRAKYCLITGPCP